MITPWQDKMRDPSTWKYRDYILAALLEHPGGQTHRLRVVRRVSELRREYGAGCPDTLEQTVQQAFERHCGESDVFCGDATLNLFCWPDGKGVGTWGINAGAVDAYLHNHRPRPISAIDL